MVERQKRFVL